MSESPSHNLPAHSVRTPAMLAMQIDLALRRLTTVLLHHTQIYISPETAARRTRGQYRIMMHHVPQLDDSATTSHLSIGLTAQLPQIPIHTLVTTVFSWIAPRLRQSLALVLSCPQGGVYAC